MLLYYRFIYLSFTSWAQSQYATKTAARAMIVVAFLFFMYVRVISCMRVYFNPLFLALSEYFLCLTLVLCESVGRVLFFFIKIISTLFCKRSSIIFCLNYVRISTYITNYQPFHSQHAALILNDAIQAMFCAIIFHLFIVNVMIILLFLLRSAHNWVKILQWM